MGEADEVVRGRVWRDGKVIAENFDFERISDHLEDPDTLTWVDICDPDHHLLQTLAGELVLEPLAVEDAIAHSERAKATRYSSHTFLTVYAVQLHTDTEVPASEGRLSVRKVSAFVFPRGLITVRSSAGFGIDEVVRRWDDNSDLLKYGVGALVHGLLDTIVDGHFEAVQILDDAMEDLEDGSVRRACCKCRGAARDLPDPEGPCRAASRRAADARGHQRRPAAPQGLQRTL